MTFLEKLDYLMERDGLNKNMLSLKSGIPYTTINGFYIRSYDNTKMSTLKKLATCFDVSLDYLMLDEITDANYGKSEKFTLEEVKLIGYYRKASEDDRKIVELTLKKYANTSPEAQLLRSEAAAVEQGKGKWPVLPVTKEA